MKLDLKRTLDGYRARAGEIRELELRPARYLMVDGQGDPNTAPQYADAVAALYPVAYATKQASRAELGTDYVVPPLEALWWADDPAAFTSRRDKARWRWTVLLLVPEHVPDELVGRALGKAGARKDRPARLDDVRLEALHEGTCLQTLHLGSYDDEGPLLERLHGEAASRGLRLTGTHHEVYLSDPRRVEPARLRTILRQPVAPT